MRESRILSDHVSDIILSGISIKKDLQQDGDSNNSPTKNKSLIRKFVFSTFY